MAIDPFGRITWSSRPIDVGSHPVAVRVSDDRGLSVTQTFDLVVMADTAGPRVSLFVSDNPAVLGSLVTFIVSATDDVSVTSRGLTIDGVPVALDGNGRATLTMSTAGSQVVATAGDAAGNSGTAAESLFVIDTRATRAPRWWSLSRPEEDAGSRRPTDVIGTVSDDNLLFYTLEVAPAGATASPRSPAAPGSVTNGVLGKFDPSTLANDSYILRLTATDAGGHVSTLDRMISVAGALKLGNFTLSFTDLSIPVSGVPITVTRTYDTLTAGRQSDLGFGWRLEFRDVDVRDSVGRTGGGRRPVKPFATARRHVTLPGGRREVHLPAEINRLTRLLIPFGLGIGVADPVFVSDAGSPAGDLSGATTLIRDTTTGEYFSASAARPSTRPMASSSARTS
jgi:hypothetical protein